VLSVEASARQGAAPLGIHAFDAFLAGKRGAMDANLGLALARQTVLAHNGHIELATSALGGTLVRVVFPAPSEAARRHRDFASRPSTRPSALPPAAQPAAVQPSIVWIDDDEAFVRTLQRFLPRHLVLGAHSIEAARELLAFLPTVPELVFCDVALGNGGAVALHRAQSAALAERFVFITGGVIPAEIAKYLIGSGRPTLIKPIAMDEVGNLLALSREEQGRSPSVAPTLQDGSSRPPAQARPATPPAPTGQAEPAEQPPSTRPERRKHKRPPTTERDKPKK